TGSTGTFTVNQGTATYNAGGGSGFSTTTVNGNSLLVLDNSTAVVNNRVGGALPVRDFLNLGGGTVTIKGGATAVSETTQIDVLNGGGIINLVSNVTAGVTFKNLGTYKYTTGS